MTKLQYKAPGIPDNCFVRGQVPMTKEEVRIITIAKAQLEKDSIIYDVGAGTGSISVEAALISSRGKVFAIEKNYEGIKLIKENAAKFSLDNLTTIAGGAPEMLYTLPEADRIIVGGSGGQLLPILETCHQKLKSGGIMVINAITLDTLWYGLSFLEKLAYQLDTSAINIAKLAPLGSTKAFQSNNPVFIIRGVKA